MPDWLRHLAHSRRARNATLGTLAILLLGSTGGQLLANYTVTGMNPLYFRAAAPQLASSTADQGLVRDLKLEDWGPELPADGTSSEAVPAEYSDASY
jgi:hypothetical protein